MTGRRALLGGTLALAAGRPAAARGFEPLPAALQRIERESGGRLGFVMLESGSGGGAAHRPAERFPMCSTFKLLAAAAVLARVDAGQERLERRVRFGRAALVPYSPITEQQAEGEGMTLAALAAAAIGYSDNTAGNLLLEAIGGPAGLTGFARGLGDAVTRLDRIEPALNEALPGDPRDTTSPMAMLTDLRRLLLGDALSAAGRERLTGWLLGSRTGDSRIRAGLPAGWRFGDKTGSGERGTTNDVGIVWPPGRPPVLFAAFLTETEAGMEQRNATLAAVGRAMAAELIG
ncbi:class A beta-lactamase [Roseicella frigidaeris]|uniref:Beta-lactamase n=1 Tax=Roseicella frigidaeris TaxID=2230885 RepID=A0A327ML67_9PROT|nr:class A beta-lactamase [Roseicella frigidaeris]RAI60898.1 class A beta-lactamase [Roseicella frigidaeris]